MNMFLENSNKSDIFDKFNKQTIDIILIGCLGMNGKKHKKQSIQLARQFIIYAKNRDYEYRPITGIDKMYHPVVIERLVDWCENMNYKNKKNIRIAKIFNKKKNEYIKQVKEEEKNRSFIDRIKYYFIKNNESVRIVTMIVSISILCTLVILFFLFYYKKWIF